MCTTQLEARQIKNIKCISGDWINYELWKKILGEIYVKIIRLSN